MSSREWGVASVEFGMIHPRHQNCFELLNTFRWRLMTQILAMTELTSPERAKQVSIGHSPMEKVV